MVTKIRNACIVVIMLFIMEAFSQDDLSNYQIFSVGNPATYNLIINLTNAHSLTIPLDGSKTSEFILASLITAIPNYLGQGSGSGHNIELIGKGDSCIFDFLKFHNFLSGKTVSDVKAFAFYKKNNGDEVIRLETYTPIYSCQVVLPNNSTLDDRRRFDYIAGQLLNLIHMATYNYLSVTNSGNDFTFKVQQ
jgi:hypothetical protein